MKQFSILLIIFSLFFTVNAKDNLLKGGKKKLFKKAEKFQKQGKHDNAAKIYTHIAKKGKRRADYAYLAGEANRLNRNYKEATKWFKNGIYKKGGSHHPLAQYKYAEMLKVNGDCDAAVAEFEQFMASYAEGYEDEWYYKAEKEIEGCAMMFKSTKGLYKVSQVKNINTSGNEVAPWMIGTDTLMYTDLTSQSTYFRLKQSIKGTDKNWQKGKLFANQINQKDENSGFGSLDPSNQTMYFTKCQIDSGDVEICNIYSSKWKNSKWSRAKKVKELNVDKANSMHPAMTITPQGQRVLYFASDREGGKGGYDIWYSIQMSTGKFTRAYNAGKVNTIGDEIAPFYVQMTESLFFSSNGHPGMGNFDIYRADGNKRYWKSVDNLGKPVNTGADDYYFVMNAECTGGYLASNREGSMSESFSTCCDDIYEFSFTREPKLMLKTSIMAGGTDLNGAEIAIYEKNDKDKKLINKAYSDNGFVMPIVRLQKYVIIVSAKGYKTQSRVIGPLASDRDKTINATFNMIAN